MAFTIDFSLLRNDGNIAGALGCAIQVLTSHDESRFERHEIPKRNPARGKRVVWEITDAATLDAYRAFATRFSAFAESKISDFPHPNAHGYVRERSILTNAAPHIGSSLLLRADIRDYFPTITQGRIESVLLDLRLDRAVASSLSRFLTLNGELPLGFPSSPLLANLASLGVDRDMVALAAKFGCAYTRYADDITLSGTADVPTKLDVESVLDKHGFRLASEKFRIKKRGQAFYVTGLSVSDPHRPRAPRRFKRRIEQELYYAETFGLHNHIGRAGYASYQSGINKLDGKIRFLHLAEPKLAKSYRARWEAILAATNAHVAFAPRMDQAPRSIDVFVDESEVTFGSHQLLSLAAVVTEDTESIRDALRELKDRRIADPFVQSRKDKLKRKGLHWSDISMDLRSELVETIAALPFRIYIAFTTRSDYEATYLELFEAVMEPRLIALDRADVTIHCEQNSSVSVEKIQRSLESIYEKLAATNNRRPRVEPPLVVAGKTEPCITLPDAALAVFHEFATRTEEYTHMRFERLRMKYRVIRSLIDGVVFTRRNPFTSSGLGFR